MTRDPASDHLDSLYLSDARGRLTGINQWDGGPVPRFHLVRAPERNAWRFRADLDPALIGALEALCQAEPVGGDLHADPRLADDALELLNRASPIEAIWRGPAYAFPPDPPFEADLPFTADGRVVAVTPDNAALLTRWLPDWLPDVAHRQPFLAAIEDGAATAVCASVRITARTHGAGVETHPSFRRRGMARRVVSAWAHAVRRQGAEPNYSTSWDNVASQSVARRLGLSLIAADFHVR